MAPETYSSGCTSNRRTNRDLWWSGRSPEGVVGMCITDCRNRRSLMNLVRTAVDPLGGGFRDLMGNCRWRSTEKKKIDQQRS